MTCVRGASALQSSLPPDDPAHPVAVLVVWEPVLLSDLGPPRRSVRARLEGARVLQFWDAARAVSKECVRSAIAHPERLQHGEVVTPDTIAWDVVAVFPPGARWGDEMPAPSFYGSTVVDAAPELRTLLAAPALAPVPASAPAVP